MTTDRPGAGRLDGVARVLLVGAAAEVGELVVREERGP